MDAAAARPVDTLASDGGVGAAGSVVEAVRSLVEIMRQGSITELDLTFGDVSVRLRGGAPAVLAVSAPPVEPITPIFAPSPPSSPSHEQHITAPMVGTFYGSPTPGSPPYVQVGDHVEIGQTVGIIEAMKIMNEIAADRAGLVTAVLVESGHAVEYGSPLIRLDPTGAGVVTVVTSES